MNKLNLPEFEHKIQDNKIFDIIRKKWVKLTEEEWVRQNVIRYFTDNLEYPEYIIGVEKEIKVFETSKRPDIVIFGKDLKPKIIIECKKPEVNIDQKVFNQAVNYFMTLNSEYFLLTNGIKHLFCKIEQKKCKFLNKIPKYKNLV